MVIRGSIFTWQFYTADNSPRGYSLRFANWSFELFTIRIVIPSNPETYLLKDSLGKPIKGGFYKYELLKTKNPDVFLIKKVLKRRRQEVFVKWSGHSSESEHNSWINKNSVL